MEPLPWHKSNSGFDISSSPSRTMMSSSSPLSWYRKGFDFIVEIISSLIKIWMKVKRDLVGGLWSKVNEKTRNYLLLWSATSKDIALLAAANSRSIIKTCEAILMIEPQISLLIFFICTWYLWIDRKNGLFYCQKIVLYELWQCHFLIRLSKPVHQEKTSLFPFSSYTPCMLAGKAKSDKAKSNMGCGYCNFLCDETDGLTSTEKSLEKGKKWYRKYLLILSCWVALYTCYWKNTSWPTTQSPRTVANCMIASKNCAFLAEWTRH